MRLLNKSLTESIYSTLKESENFFVGMIEDRISEYADPEEYFLDKLTDEDVEEIANDLKKTWDSGHFEQSDLDEYMEDYAYRKYGPKEESLKESEKYVIKYWATEEDRDEGFSDVEYIKATDKEDAIAKTREMYYDNNWASCELGNANDEEVEDPIFGMYPGEKKVEEERFDESVTVAAGSTYVAVDETGVVVDDNGTTITVDGGASVTIENNEVAPMEEPIEEPIEETPAEEPVGDVEEVEDTEEEIIEPSEELIEPEEDEEDELEESEEIDVAGFDKGKELEKLHEGEGKVTSEDLNSEGVNYVFTYGDQDDPKTEYLTCFWSSNDVTEDDIPEGDNLEDYGAINYEIYDTEGNEVDGGLLVTKEDEFDEKALLQDLCGLSGYNETRFIDIERKPNGNYSEVFGIEEGCKKDDEDKLEENAGDPNSTVEIYKNPEFDYEINDVTELDNIDTGDVRSIDMFSILNGLEESLQKRYGTENWGLLNTFQTRQGKHKRTNESYASAILDVSIPKTEKLQELNTVLTVEVFGDKALKECVVKDARYNKKIERFCGKTTNPVKFLEGVMVDLINNRSEIQLTKYQPMEEDVKELKEEVADEAYTIADLIDKRCGYRLQDGVNGERILRRDDFDEEFAIACREVFNLKDEDMDNFWGDEEGSPLKKFDSYSGIDNVWDLENTVRGILGYQGYETIFETDEDRKAEEGDLVLSGDKPVNEDVEIMVNKPYEDKGMNFADGRAIEKDIKRQENHLKQHKSLGKVVGKKFDVGKEPDQKNTQGEKIEDITDTEKVESRSPSSKKKGNKKKKVEESVNEDADRILLNPVENFGYTDPYASYYKDDNGNLYKSVDNGNELYICTKAGEPLKDVSPEKFILGDQALNELKEAKGLLDGDDTEVVEDSEELVDVDDELEEGATEVAIFHRKPASVEAMQQAEANGITVNKSNYKIIGTKELSGEEFDNFSKHLSSGQYPWLKDMYKADNSNSGMFNCIEVKNADDSSITLLVDPNGYDYARYAAIKNDLTETPEDIEEEPIEEPEAE